MNDIELRSIAAVVTACLFCIATLPSLGAMQQSGYKNGNFMRWLKRKDNMSFNRLCVLALCLGLSSTATALCFSFFGERIALALSAIPFWGLVIGFCFAGEKYALKVKINRTGRVKRLFVAYCLLTAIFAYACIAVLWLLSSINGSFIYGLIAYLPFALCPLCLPMLLCAANGIMGIFENARNAKFVKRAGQVLDESKIIRIGIVGSYGKTSVKNILKTLLAEKYSVVETPESYNTPMGIAKTVLSPEFADKEVFIAEMGARKRGDIQELCALVKPDYAIFTGVCEQHIATFGTLENIWSEKKEIIKSGARVVCGADLKVWAQEEFGALETLTYADMQNVTEKRLGATSTSFVLTLGGERIVVETSLLGDVAVENIVLAATLAYQMGVSTQEIAQGVKKLQPIPHRLQLLENNGISILDDGYNCNQRGAKEGIAALKRFDGRTCIVTPGIIECGILEESVNGALGKEIAEAGIDKVILVGETLVGAVKTGYLENGGGAEKLQTVPTLQAAQTVLQDWLQSGDAVLFLNDLPDVY